VIRSFVNEATQDIFDGKNSKKARSIIKPALLSNARRKLDLINAAIDLNDLKIPPSNHLESLNGDLKGKHSIRINLQYRIVFRWTIQGAEEVEIIDYHK
jgi:proteic killer suppression protein